MQRVIEGAGTTEARWRPWLAEQDLPVLDVSALAAGRRVLVVGAHPDDEVLGAGGLLAALAGLGAHVNIIRATDGEASHPDAGLDPHLLAARRRGESARALGELGLHPACEKRLALPDGAVRAHPQALRARLFAEVRPDDLLLAPYSDDGHPDHEACGELAGEVAAARGARRWEYPIWAWHWAAPGDARLPWHRAAKVTLTDATAAAKQRAIHCFTSQTQPLGPHPEQAAVLPPAVLARFTRPEEVLLA